MAIISNNVFEGIADRLAFQAKEISDAIDAMQVEGGGFYFARVTGTDDYGIENPLITPANTLDNNLPNFSGTEKTLLTNTFSSLINGLNTHINTVGTPSGITTMDNFLTTSGINVHYSFNDAYNASLGSNLNSINVFGPQMTLAQVDMTSSGVGTFTSVRALGTGSGKAAKSPANYCAAPFEVIVSSDIGGVNDLILDVQTTKEDLSSDSNQVVIPAGTGSGTGFDVGTPATDKYIAVSNVVPAGGNNNDQVLIKNKLLRDIAL